jgi:PAS domain S-box-containing protein
MNQERRMSVPPSLRLDGPTFITISSIGIRANAKATIKRGRDNNTVDAELDTKLAVPRKHSRFGLPRPCIGLVRAFGNASPSTRLNILGTALLFIWTLVLIALIAINNDLRTPTMLVTLLLVIGVTALFLCAGIFEVFHPGTNQRIRVPDKPETVSDSAKWNEADSEPARTEISSIASAFRQMTDRLDDVTLTVNYLGDIISSLSIGLLVIDESGRVRMANPAFRTMAGFRPEGESVDGLIGMQLTTLFGQEPDINHTLAVACGKGVETTLKLPDGNVLPAMLVATPLPNSDSIKGAVCAITDLSERKLAEKHVRAGRERIESLVQHLHEIQEIERNRIARDLHDDLGAILTALRNGLVRLSGLVGTDASAAANDLVELADTANISVDRVIKNLWPQMLDHFGLGGALEVLAGEFENTHGIATTCRLDSRQVRFDRRVALALYRTSQEALTNIAKHAHARSALVSLVHRDFETVLEVSDDGHGFTKRAGQEREGGYGLLGMRQRIAAVNGEFSIETGMEGSKITIRVPQTSHQAGASTGELAGAPEGNTNDQSTAG